MTTENSFIFPGQPGHYKTEDNFEVMIDLYIRLFPLKAQV